MLRQAAQQTVGLLAQPCLLSLSQDAPILNRIKWNYLIVDEAHRLKNAESALYQVGSLILGWGQVRLTGGRLILDCIK